MNAIKILTTLIGSVLIGFAFFGLTFSAMVAEDGALRATSLGLLAGIVAFGLTFLVVLTILDMGK